VWGTNFKDEIDGPLSHDTRGILSMANKGKNTNSSQLYVFFNFYFCVLLSIPLSPFLPNLYFAFHFFIRPGRISPYIFRDSSPFLVLSVPVSVFFYYSYPDKIYFFPFYYFFILNLQ
jgi:cyclophilin family peptidyl-prolyl cis-trans isomerase